MANPGIDTNTATVREEIARARDILRARAARVEDGTRNSEDFLRRYLRILGLQAVGQFADGMAALSEGVTALGASHAAHAERLTVLEQDLLALARALPSATAHAGTLRAADVYTRAAERLALEERRGIEGAEIGEACEEWMSTAAAVAGVALAPASAEDLASRPEGSAGLVSAMFLFDALSEPEAAAVASSSRRVLARGGLLLAVFDPVLASQGIVRPVGRRPVASPGVLTGILRDAGLAVLTDQPLDEATRGPRLVLARRD